MTEAAKTPGDEFLFVEEVARELRAPVRTVRYWIATGRLRSVRPGKRHLVRRADLDAMLRRTANRSERPEE